MTSPQILYVLQWLIRDTFLQAFSSKVFWGLMIATGMCVIFCLGLSIEGGGSTRAPDDPYDHFRYHPQTGTPLTKRTEDLGKLHLLYGVMSVGIARDRESTVEMVQVIFGTWIAGSFGVLVTLIWASCWLPEFLQPSQITVLLAKPSPRWLYLAGKFAGVLLFVGFQAIVFFFGTWIALGIKTGVWPVGYLVGIPLLTLHFAAFYCFSMMVAVFTRHPVASVLGTLFFWVVCVATNYGRHSAVVLPDMSSEVAPLSPLTMTLTQTSYWVFPKPLDYLIMLEQPLNSDHHMATISGVPEIRHVLEQRQFDPIAVVMTSFAFMAGSLIIGGRQFAKTDY